MYPFYISKAVALQMGLTHEGSLYGIPAWFDGDDAMTVGAIPKCPALVIWCKLADLAYELVTYFMSSDSYIVAPIHVKGPIK